VEIKDKLTHLLQRLKKTNNNHADRKVRDMLLHEISWGTTLDNRCKINKLWRLVRPTQHRPTTFPASGDI